MQGEQHDKELNDLKKELEEVREKGEQNEQKIEGMRDRLRRAVGHFRKINRNTTYEELLEIVKLAIGNVKDGGDKDGPQQ